MTAPPEYTYDVFISHSADDKRWVDGFLLPHLTKAGLNVCVPDDFEIGVPKLMNVERAIQGSRKVLLVLTPSWVGSEWAHFDALLVQASDPVGQLRRTMPLVLEPCKLPDRIAMLSYADFTQPAGRDAEMERLLRALRTKAHIFICKYGKIAYWPRSRDNYSWASRTRAYPRIT